MTGCSIDLLAPRKPTKFRISMDMLLPHKEKINKKKSYSEIKNNVNIIKIIILLFERKTLGNTPSKFQKIPIPANLQTPSFILISQRLVMY